MHGMGCDCCIIINGAGDSLKTFHSGFVNRFAKFPNIPYRYVFQQLLSEVSLLHRTPLKRRQSAKIHTTIIWGAWEHKSRSSVCRRSNVGLPICLYPFLMQSVVLQIFIKVLNISFFPITLHSLRFMIHAKTKPNNGLRGVAFSWASFDLWPTNHINFAIFHVKIINKLKIKSNWCIVLCLESFQLIDTLVMLYSLRFLFLS